MPNGRGRGRGKGQGRGQGRQRVMSFLQPCLLFLLTRGEAHGYSLLDGLEAFGFARYQFDSSLAYRALRNMEDAGWVDSRWDDASQGPRRRVYQIQTEGKTRLTIWMDDLRRTRDEIDRLLQTYEDEIGRPVGR